MRVLRNVFIGGALAFVVAESVLQAGAQPWVAYVLAAAIGVSCGTL